MSAARVAIRAAGARAAAVTSAGVPVKGVAGDRWLLRSGGHALRRAGLLAVADDELAAHRAELPPARKE